MSIFPWKNYAVLIAALKKYENRSSKKTLPLSGGDRELWFGTSYRRQALSKLNQQGNFQMLGMVSYWTFFHENLSEFTSGVFLATVKVGSIYVDFSSYNYETQMMMISKLFTIEKMKIWKIMLNFSKNSKIKINKFKKNQKIKNFQNLKQWTFSNIFSKFSPFYCFDFFVFWVFLNFVIFSKWILIRWCFKLRTEML